MHPPKKISGYFVCIVFFLIFIFLFCIPLVPIPIMFAHVYCYFYLIFCSSTYWALFILCTVFGSSKYQGNPHGLHPVPYTILGIE